MAAVPFVSQYDFVLLSHLVLYNFGASRLLTFASAKAIHRFAGALV